nr:EAL domain-containing protein [uncultured Oscillibacter sp.]
MEKANVVNRSDQCQEGLTKNVLTGLLFPEGFMEEAGRFAAQAEPGAYCVAAMDILHFRLFNKLYGRDAGDRLLRQIADHFEDVRREYGGVTGYFQGDDFCIIMPWRMELAERLRDRITRDIAQIGSAIGVIPVFGICPIDDPGLSPENLYDRATLARAQAGPQNQIACYDPEMERDLEEEMHLLTEVIGALERDEFTFFVQPQCDITSGKVVGAESLVRWRHSTEGLIPPGKFIPALERCGAVYLLDQQVWEKVCRWLRSWIDRGYEPVPISINISRIDIMSMDVPAYLKRLLKKYDLPAKYIKTEITESAYTQEDSSINETVDRLRQDGFLVMMDDFGSGYSSLNMLKSIPVDVLKIDMRFLEITEENEQKGIGILESIVNMARLLGMPIIVEGVETPRQESVLRSMGCRYTQGYYYYRPLPIDQFESLLADERQLDFTGLRCKQVEAFHMREIIDGNLFTDTMLNHILGPTAICDVFERQVELTRVNEQYYRMTGLNAAGGEDMSRKVWSGVRDDDRPVLLALFDRAYESRPAGAEGNIHYLRVDGKVLWLHLKVFFLQENEGHRIYFVASEDITSLREQRKAQARAVPPAMKLPDIERQRLEQYYGTLPCGFGLSRIVLDQEGEPTDYEIVYINREMERMCGNDFDFIRSLILKAFKDDSGRLLRKAYQAAFLGESVEHFAYSSVSGHYLQITLFQHDHGYVACLLRDVTHRQLYEGAFNSMVLAYREVYYLQLQDNYCRMIYPDQTSVTERGNYAAMVERHFGTGKILKYDEKNVRNFLSLDHLRSALATQNSVDYRYRRSGKESPDEWCLTSVTISERENEKPKSAVITIQSIDKIMREEEERQQERMAESLANMSDAFFIYRAIEDERILYANPAVMELFGCESMTELMELVQCSFRGMVHPEDLARVEWEIQHQIRNSAKNMDYVRYRIIRRDGEIRWVDDYGHLETSKWGEEHRLFYVFIKDITDTITSVQKEKLLNSNQFYS